MRCVNNAPAPLYRDPIFDGAADPMVIYNHTSGSWQMFYTQRRANVDSPGVAYCYGSAIGVAESVDGGNTFYYIGSLALDFEPGHNTFWAPEIIFHEDVYHMYVTYIRGVRWHWSGKARILHYTSPDLWNWVLRGDIEMDDTASVIDACVFPLPEGGLRLWYKHEQHSHIWAANSQDGVQWRSTGPVITDTAGEGPNVFALGGFFWMIVDVWAGQAVYRSDDLTTWIRQEKNILAHPGTRPEDGAIGGHADVVTRGDCGYVFYFTHPMRTGDYRTRVNECLPYGQVPYQMRRSSIQAAKIRVECGILLCDRNAPLDIQLA